MTRKTGINRESEAFTVKIASGAAATPAIDFSHWAGGVVIVPSAWTSANIGFYVSDTIDGTYVILRDDSGTPVQISNIKTDGSRAYKLPDDVFGVLFMKLWSKNTTAATETDTNQASTRTLTLVCKG